MSITPASFQKINSRLNDVTPRSLSRHVKQLNSENTELNPFAVLAGMGGLRAFCLAQVARDFGDVGGGQLHVCAQRRMPSGRGADFRFQRIRGYLHDDWFIDALAVGMTGVENRDMLYVALATLFHQEFK